MEAQESCVCGRKECADMLKNFTREEKSWMLYDWANSAHTVIIVTLLPIFYATVASYTANSGSAMSTWGYVTSAAMLICAVLAPLLGAIGDFRGYRKKLFVAFLAVGVLSVLIFFLDSFNSSLKFFYIFSLFMCF